MGETFGPNLLQLGSVDVVPLLDQNWLQWFAPETPKPYFYNVLTKPTRRGHFRSDPSACEKGADLCHLHLFLYYFSQGSVAGPLGEG